MIRIEPEPWAAMVAHARRAYPNECCGAMLGGSEDGAKTWSAVKVLDPGPSGYSDLAVGPDGSIYCLYERGPKNFALTVAKFPLSWIAEPAKK